MTVRAEISINGSKGFQIAPLIDSGNLLTIGAAVSLQWMEENEIPYQSIKSLHVGTADQQGKLEVVGQIRNLKITLQNGGGTVIHPGAWVIRSLASD